MNIKRIALQVSLIVTFSFIAGLTYNLISGSSLPIFKKYQLPPPPPEVDEDLSQYYTPMDIDTLRGLQGTDMVVIVDARKAESFQEGHIPSAINIPLDEFPQKYPDLASLLQEGKTIVIYCIGVHCIDSSMMARELVRRGHQDIFVFKGGMEEWEAEGNPMEQGGGEDN